MIEPSLTVGLVPRIAPPYLWPHPIAQLPAVILPRGIPVELVANGFPS